MTPNAPEAKDWSRKMPHSIRILQVFGHTGRGGSELRTLELLRHLDRRRYQLQFCTLSGRSGSLDDEIRSLDAQVHPIRLRRFDFPSRFRKLLRTQEFDVVHSNVHYMSGYILRLAAQCGTPVRIAHFHNAHDSRGANLARAAYRNWMRRYLDRHATHLLGCSRYAMAGAWGPDWKSDPRCRVAYYGLEPSDFDAPADHEGVRQEFAVPWRAPLCIHVGRLVDQKNHLRLISIFARLLERRPDARLLLVGRGDGASEARVRSRIRQLGIDQRVVFCRERTDVPRLLKAADLMIFPSLWEGLPGVVLEACAVGTPVVAADLPGIQEIADRLPGVRALSLDTPDRQWASQIDHLLSNRSSDVARRDAGRIFAAGPFTVDRYVRQICNVWDAAAPGLPSQIRKAA